MNIQRDIDITSFTTLRLPAKADFFCVVKNNEEFEEAFQFASEQSLRVIALGGGSNLVIGNLSDTLVVKNEIQGIEETTAGVFCVGAGEIWDEFVEHTTKKDIACLAPLSFIPGTVGGAPIQNIGAYGAEAGDYIRSVEVFDIKEKVWLSLSSSECDFKYRDSIFKQNKERYFVTQVVFDLRSCECTVPDYPGIKESIASQNPNAGDIRNAIIKVRQSKLPDWKTIWNVGSFFKNPETDRAHAEKIKQEHPHMKYFETGNGQVKIPAGWLIEEAGLKGLVRGNFGTYEKHALVVVHNGKGSYEELLSFKKYIVDSVQEKFGITLEQEPIEL